MGRLNPKKLHVSYMEGVDDKSPIVPRRYTLTHSDATGDLFLTIGPDYSLEQISGWYTRLMRDEVLAEWKDSEKGPSLHLYCHVSGGIVFGSASWRAKIFRTEMQLVLEAIRHGDRTFFTSNPELDHAPIWVHFQASESRYHKIERWGVPADYKV